jgi:putative ABC transport system permease protein
VRMAVVGILLGLGLVFALKGILDSVLYGVGAFDASTVVGTAVLLTTIATAASWLPARRAVAVDPTVALRAE